MDTGYYLLDHRNPNGDHFYTTRRRPLIAQIMHITAGLEDIDLIGKDNSAEGVSNYAATTPRSVSWHTGSDTDGFIDLLPYDYTAFQCVDYNSSTAGHEISKLETDWRDDNPEVIRRRLHWAAEAIRPKLIKYKIPMRKVSKAEVDKAIANGGPPVGLISHGELDPSRRTDPGWVWEGGKLIDTFPWTQFFAILRGESGQNLGEGMKPKFVKCKDNARVYLILPGDRARHINGQDEWDATCRILDIPKVIAYEVMQLEVDRYNRVAVRDTAVV